MPTMTKEEFFKVLDEAPDALHQWLINQGLDNIEGQAILGKTLGRMIASECLASNRDHAEYLRNYLLTLKLSAELQYQSATLGQTL